MQHRSRDSVVYTANAPAMQPWAPALTYTADQLILQASYMGQQIPTTEFLRLEDPVYGACYQFNRAGDHKNDR